MIYYTSWFLLCHGFYNWFLYALSILYICNFIYIETLHLLSDVVRANKNTTGCSEFEIIEIIKTWLVRSKERFYNNNKTLKSNTSKKSQTESKETQQGEISTVNEPNEEQIIE